MVLGPALALGAMVALIGVLVDRLVGPGLAWWHWVAWPAAGAAALSILIVFLRRGTLLDAAVEVDHALELEDRLASALELSRTTTEDSAFAQLAMQDAERVAQQVHVAQAIPIRFGRLWATWPALFTIAGVIGWQVTPMDLLGAQHAKAVALHEDSRVAQAAEQIQQLAAPDENAPDKHDLPTGAADAPIDDLAANRQALLDELSHKLIEGNATPDEARAEAAGILDEEAQQREQAAQQLERQAQVVEESLGSIEPGGTVMPEIAQLREQLHRGDMSGAAQSLDGLEDQLSTMSAEERSALAQEMSHLSEDLKQIAEQDRQRAEQAAAQAQQVLQEQGLGDDEARDLAQRQSADEVQKALEERGVDEDVARRVAQDVQRQRDQERAHEQAANDTEQLGQHAEQAADELKSEKPTADQPPTDDDPEKQTDQSQGEARDAPQQDQQPDQGESDGDRGQSQPAEGGQTDPKGEPTEQGQEGTQGQPTDQQGAQPSENGTSPDGQPTPDAQRQEGEGQPTDQSIPDAQPGADVGEGEGSQQGEGEQQSSENGKHVAPSSEQQQQPGQQGKPDSEGKPGAQPTSDTTPGDQPGEHTGADEGAQPGAEPGDTTTDQDGATEDAPPGDAPAGTGEPTPGSETDEPPEGAAPPGDGPAGDSGPSDAPDSKDASPPPGDSKIPADSPPDDAAPGASGPSDTDGPTESGKSPLGTGSGGDIDEKNGGGAPGEIPEPPEGKALEKLRKQLRELAERNKRAQDERNRAEDAREKARNILKELSPDERERLARWAKAIGHENMPVPTGGGAQPGLLPGGLGASDQPQGPPQPLGSELVDARRGDQSGAPDSNDKVIENWSDLPDDQPGAHSDPGVSRREMSKGLREARKGAERAIEDRQIPSRYSKVLEEYFRKALKRAHESGEETGKTPTPAPAAKDAGSDKKDG